MIRNPPGKMTSFIFEATLLEEFRGLCQREGRSMKQHFEDYMKDHVKVHKEGNPQHLITSSMENEDFMGFPAIALSPQNKRKYLKKMPEDMKQELYYNVQEWLGMLKEP